MLQAELSDAGYHVLPLAARHQEALETARAGKPDLALVNIELEGGDDGVALACDLHAMGIPVLFISGQTSRAMAARSVAIGSLPKPYSGNDMIKAVDHLLHLLHGDEAHPCPKGLDVFGDRAADTPHVAV
jgi:DNA-binding response OmpR family regulator